MRIRALSVFEGVVYHCYAVDANHPSRPTLEVDALTRAGDLDQGPLLITIDDWARMVGDVDRAKACVAELQARGRLVEHQGVLHVTFPTWTVVT